MPLDPYQPCPAGRDKKLKFCCGTEIMEDLNKLDAAIEGEQWVSALELAQRLVENRPDRACLLMHLGLLQLRNGQTEPARQTAQRLLAVAPDSPVGQALLAYLESAEGSVDQAVRSLAESLSLAAGRKLPSVLFAAMVAVAKRLAEEGEWVVCLALLRPLLQATQGREEQILRLYQVALHQMHRQTPVEQSLCYLRTHLPPERGSEAVRQRFQQAAVEAMMGQWRRAAESLEALAREVPDEPAIWTNLGTVRRWLLMPQAAAEAFRKLASLPQVSPEEAIEAEATAQVLLSEVLEDHVLYLDTQWAVTDLPALKEHLLSSRQVRPLPLTPFAPEENQPPPQGLFQLLDRPLPASGVGLTRDQVPHLVGMLTLYGKETDRPARIHLSALERPGLKSPEETLRLLAGPWMGEKLQQRVVSRVHPGVATLVPLAFPADTPPELRQRLAREEHQLYLLSIWPNLPMKLLDGRTPRQAIFEPEGQRRVQAMILLMEYTFDHEDDRFDKLRRALGLPLMARVDPTQVDLDTLGPLAWLRVQRDKLTDEQLLKGLRLAEQRAFPRLLEYLGREALQRPSLENRTDLNLDQLLLQLSELAPTAEQALELIRRGRDLAIRQKRSPAPHLRAEIECLMQRGDVEAAMPLLDQLVKHHLNEPETAEFVLEFLLKTGLARIDPITGQLHLQQPGAQPPLPAGVSEAPAAASLWTPDQPVPAPPSAAPARSKLWIPGNE